MRPHSRHVGKCSIRSVRSNHRLATRAFEALEPRVMLTTVSNVTELYAAVNNGVINDTITILPGTFVLTQSLKPKAGQILDGAGIGQTILVPAAAWIPSTSNLPDNGTSASTNNPAAYLIDLAGNDNIDIFDMTLDGNDQLHGAIFGNNADSLDFYNLHMHDYLWSGIRTFGMDNSTIRDNTFENTGGRWKAGGVPGDDGGVTGGGVYVTYMKTSEIAHNDFFRTNQALGAERNFYGIKGREARNSRIHHNTINVNFSIEFPHENDHYVEIDHNYLLGTVSIPKHGGGSLPSGSDPYTFDIHHNYFRKSYALEWARNGARIHDNLFDFTTADDGGNLITNFADGSVPPSNGPTLFYNNLIKNPGRGLYNSNGHLYSNFSFFNNHVIGNTTVTPRTEGMFGLPTATNFSTITVKDNIFEFIGQSRPLFRNAESRAGVNVENNTLTNVSDSGQYSNPNTGAPRGPLEALLFTLGRNNEFTVDQWNISPTEVNLSPTDDAFVRGGSSYANQNFGDDGTLIVRKNSNLSNTRQSFLKFAAPATGPVASAKLVLTPTLLTNPGQVQVRIRLLADGSDGWSEGTITWNNKPTGSGSAITVQGSSMTLNSPLEIDVTNLVNQALHANTSISFHLDDTSNNSTAQVNFASSENANATYRPVLVIDQGAAAGPNYRQYFDNGNADGLTPATGTWSVNTTNRYVGNQGTGYGISVIDVGAALPTDFDVYVTTRTKTTYASLNSYVIFDYVDANNFKYAAMKDGADLWVIGQRVSGTDTDLATLGETINTDTDYALSVRVRGGTVSLLVNGALKVSHTFAGAVNGGNLALGVSSAESVFDNLSINAA